MQRATREHGRGRLRTALKLAALVTALTVLAGACDSSGAGRATGITTRTRSSRPPERPRSGGSLVVGVEAETSGWNPSLADWSDDGNLVGSTVLEPLATTGPGDKAMPWLAASWYPDATFDKWVIDLTPGVRFGDGEPFDATAAAFNVLTYARGPLTGLAFGSLISGVKILSNLSFEVDLTQPWAAFPTSYLTGPAAYMMAPAMIKAPDHGVAHPIGTGPFTFSGWVPGSTFTANRNPDYWGGRDGAGKVRSGQGLPHLDQIQFKVITDGSTRTAALQDGDLNMMLTTSAVTAGSVARSFHETKDWDTEQAFIMTNTSATIGGRPNPLSDIHARAALAYATDPSRVAEVVGGGVHLSTAPWSSASTWGLPASQTGYVHRDLAQAKREVAQYEKDTGQSGLNISLLGVADVDDARTLQQLQAQWKQAGISTEVDTVQQSTFITDMATGAFQGALFRNYGFADPDADYNFFASSAVHPDGQISIDFTRYSSPEMDHDLAVGRQSGYVGIRRPAYQDLIRRLNASFTNIWLYSTPYTLVSAPAIHGLDGPDGPASVPFGTFAPKTWWADVWMSS